MQAAASKELGRSKRGLPKRHCGARTRGGAKCKRPAGWGTDHPGTGKCKNHGGSSPSGKKAAAKQELQDFMGAAAPLMDVDPIEALLYAVRRASGVAAYCRHRTTLVEPDDEVKDGELNIWPRLEMDALASLARFSKMALDAGVAERRVRLAERVGELIAQALEESLADVDLTTAQRARVARTFATRLAVLEHTGGEGPSLDG